MNSLAVLGSEIKALATNGIARRMGFAGTSGGMIGPGVHFLPGGVLPPGFSPGSLQSGAPLDFAALAGDPLMNPTVAICVDRIAQALPDAPPILEKQANRDKWERVDDHEVLDLLRNPNPYHSAADVWGLTVSYECTRGQAFWVIPEGKGNSKPSEIWVANSDRVRVEGTEDQFISQYYIAAENGDLKPFTDPEIIHFRHQLNPYNPRLGWAPLSAGSRQITGDHAAATYQTSILRNCGVLSLLIAVKDAESAGKVTPNQIESFVTALRKKLAEGGAGSIAGLNLPLEVHKMGYSPDEMAIDKLITYFKTDICALLNVSRRVADLGEDPTYENLEVALKDFWVRNIIPRRNRHAATLTTQLLPRFGLDPKEWRIAFDYSNVQWLQEGKDDLHQRVREDYKAGIPDLFQAAAALGYETSDEMKGVRYKPSAKDANDEQINEQLTKRANAQVPK